MKISEQFALDTWLSYYPVNMTYDQIIGAMTDLSKADQLENLDVWQTVESYDYEQIAEWIEDTRSHFEYSAKLVIAETGYEVALRELLNYTGGWDITDEDHPIYIARKALEKEASL